MSDAHNHTAVTTSFSGTKLPPNKELESEENTGETPDGLRCGDGILDTTPKAHSLKERAEQLDLLKTENFCS